MPIASIFIRASVRHLEDDYLPRIRDALALLAPEDLWWRSEEHTNSVGNLLLHLQGNVRQWIVSGLGGATDARDRASEFGRRGGEPFDPGETDRLFATLSDTVHEACSVIESMGEARLAVPVRIQGFDTTGLEAIYHVVEHFSWHVGQIVAFVKMRSARGASLHFYDDARINELRNER
ncbi:MAG: DUF1572 family protein [Planctomycetes bacterium]|nr:DUF1572 family protein [Planctomycetota bacterium]